MIKRICAALALAIAFAWPAAPASAACDYDVGGSPPFLMTTLEAQLDEELGCIGAIIADGTKGDITVSAGGTVLTINANAVAIGTDVSGLGAGVATFLATPSSANLAGAVTGETGSGALVFGTSPALTTPNLGTPSAATLTNATGLPISTGVSGLGTGVATALATPSSANLRAAVTDEIGTGALMFGLAPTMANGLSCTASQVVRWNAAGTAFECATLAGGGNALTSDPLSQFAATTSAQLRGVMSDEVGTGAIMFGLSASMADDLGCTGSQVVRRNAGDTAFECATGGGGGISNVVEDTTPQLGGALDANGFGIELGTAQTDTTLTRSAAGIAAVEGVAIPTISSTHTLTNKTISGGSNTITGIDSTAITDGAVANADLANMAQATVKGRAAGAGTGAPVDLSQTQLTALVNTFTTSLSGAAPASGGGTTNFLRADGTWAAPSGGGASADVQTFNSSGTWTKPSGGQTMTMIECWGGGGSGARHTTGNAAGGGGGSYNWRVVPISSLGATETVTIGAGGASVTTGAGVNGNNGGDSTFGSWLTGIGGGGGGFAANGAAAFGGSGAGLVLNASAEVGGSTGGGSTNTFANTEGGGASGGGTTSGGASRDGGRSMKGGGGGGSSGTNSDGAGGTAVIGGNGGAGNAAGAATAGSQPGGGGGGARNNNSGAGGAGRCVATSY